MGIPVSGFVTQERRERRRIGFSLERFGGLRGLLAHVDLPGPPRVGRYGVDISALERLAIPALLEVTGREVAIIDELGKMELASQPFRDAVSAIFDRSRPCTARHPFTAALRRRPDIETMRLTTAMRDELPQLLAARLGGTR